MKTHTDHTFATKEEARQEMHRWRKGDKDGVRHKIWQVEGERVFAKTDNGSTVYVVRVDNEEV